MAQAAHKQVTKPATKGATVTKGKAAPATKTAAVKTPATKPAGKTKSKAAPAPKGPAFFLKNRPGSGKLLFAYTMAWLQDTGLIDGGSISREDAVKFAGATAIGYHTNVTGRMVDKGGVISLATGAANLFADRAHADADREAYREILRTGKVDGKLVKQEWMIGKLGDQAAK